MNYIIDFERINKLSTHPNDHLSEKSLDGALFTYGITRKTIKEYLEAYHKYTIEGTKRNLSDSEAKRFQMVIDTLEYNRILIDKRDHKIGEILEA